MCSQTRVTPASLGARAEALALTCGARLCQSQQLCIMVKDACVIIAEVQVCPALQLQACCSAAAAAPAQAEIVASAG